MTIRAYKRGLNGRTAVFLAWFEHTKRRRAMRWWRRQLRLTAPSGLPLVVPALNPDMEQVTVSYLGGPDHHECDRLRLE